MLFRSPKGQAGPWIGVSQIRGILRHKQTPQLGRLAGPSGRLRPIQTEALEHRVLPLPTQTRGPSPAPAPAEAPPPDQSWCAALPAEPMTALSARGHLTLGAVVIRRGEAGGARQQGWAQEESRRRERGPGTRPRAPAFLCRLRRPLALLSPASRYGLVQPPQPFRPPPSPALR